MREAIRCALVLIGLVGCSLEPPAGRFACDTDGDCPSGWVCAVDGRCYRDGEQMDAGPRDGGGCGTDCDGGPVDTGPPPACTTALECDDDNECTTDECVDEVCSHVNDDTLSCASGEGQCSAGSCVCLGCFDGTRCRTGSTPDACGGAGAACVSCDDGLACTADLCANTPPECQHFINDGFCLIDGVCWAAGTRDPSNDCRECAPTMNDSGWTELASAAVCTRVYMGTPSEGKCGGSPLFCCGLYAAACSASEECCDSVPCTSGRCRYP